MTPLTERELSYLMDAVAECESGFNAEALSEAGAQGMYQLMPATAAELYAELLCGRQYNPWDADIARLLATRYMRKLLRRYSNDICLSLAAYNWGMGRVAGALEKARIQYGSSFQVMDKFEMIRPHAPMETQEYVERVTEQYNKRVRYLTPKGLLQKDAGGATILCRSDPAS